MRTALERVAAYSEAQVHALGDEDLKAVVAAAKREEELRRRIRFAARKLTAWCKDTDAGGLVEAAMALDLRYALPKRGRWKALRVKRLKVAGQ